MARYLIAYIGHLDEAVTILNDIAKINNKPEIDPDDRTRIRRLIRRESKKRKIFNYYHLFSFKSLRYITIPTFIVNMVFNVSYYGIQYSFNELGLELFYNALYVGIAEVLSYLLACNYNFFLKLVNYVIDYLIPRTERRKSVLIGYLLTTLVCFCYFADLDGMTQTVFMFVIFFAI